MTHIVLVNAWHDDNKGDSAITDGILRLAAVAHPDATVTVVGLTENPDPHTDGMRHVAHNHPDAILRPTPMPSELRGQSRSRPAVDVPIWFGRLVGPAAAAAAGRVPARYARLFADADLVVGVGGSNLYTDASVQPMVSLARLFTLSAPIRAATRMRIPTVLLGHTLGPFPADRPGARRLARHMLADADRVVVRDAASVTVAEELGLGTAELAPDMAYALTPNLSPRVAAIIAGLPGAVSRTAVIALRSHPSLSAKANSRLVAEIVDAAQALCRTGYIDRILVVAHTLGPTPIEDDRPMSDRLYTSLTARAVPATYLDADLSPTELAALYGAAGAMIAVRLHAAVLATLSGTPTFAIAYFSSKSHGVMASSGLDDAVGDFASVTAADITAALTRQLSSTTARRDLADIAAGHHATLTSRAPEWFGTRESCSPGIAFPSADHLSTSND
ncbi:polysaccharide pyruvyl transferase family protein [Gordonia sp. ABSL1-1]|uniref:polysaccharide pyruvyl transferase family protein n=1 Tax=Gordonia sp. ABSL1-1 TaxID=3053923 RepID=UPI00257326AD|nr:polysaccharide pyruvyl transferase family protein [Gordonia sp. ABSL1-1]MDL9936075.1 polysaccharide pyruvyl transferase family protein [Gordonia sp. ABSL1-1]